MRLEFTPDLIERAVFLKAREAPTLEAEVHRACDALYALPAGPEREEHFFDVYLRFFRRLNLGDPLFIALEEFPSIGESCGRCLVRDAGRRGRESADLLVREENGKTLQTALVRLCPESLLDPGEFFPTMRRELMHVADMLDPRFQYRREAIDGLPARQNLVRDRYRVLWDVYIEGRLKQARNGWQEREAMLTLQFAKLFHRAGADTDAGFNKLLDAPEGSLDHARLVDWAKFPERLFGSPPRDAAQTTREGVECPLCRMPAYDWFDFDAEGSTVVKSAIRRRYPAWRTHEGACRQCAELLGGHDFVFAAPNPISGQSDRIA